MTDKIADWLNDHIDSLLGERSASQTAGEADTEEQVRLMKAARRLKRASGPEPVPEPLFVARLETELRRTLAGSAPKVVRPPFWSLSWFRPVAGIAAAAAVFLFAFLLLQSPAMFTAPAGIPSAALREQARAPEAAPSPSPPGAADSVAGQSPSAPAAPATASRPLAGVVQQAETILVGRVVGTSALSAPGPGGAYDVRLVISVERYLKGAARDNQVNVLASSRTGVGGSYVPGQRVLVMAGTPPYPSGELPLLPDPQAAHNLGQGEPDAAAQTRKTTPGGLTEAELIAQIEAILKPGS